ncbi:MAG: hypothetical protein GX233_04505 [Erysipelothrix sp.]|nr:hypothetical protein [Erysipelothrix sp.]
MVDIHTHVLANMDDGASSYEESLQMIKMMELSGIKNVVATSHFDVSKQDIEEFLLKRSESLNATRQILVDQNINVTLLSGCELMFTPQLAHVDLAPFTIENTDYVLIELSTRYDNPSLLQTFELIIGNGFIPILAHVERYSYLISDSSRIVELINQGVLMQVNVKSIDNEKYPYIKSMFKNNLIHLIASDAHNMKNRAPNLRKELVSESIYKNMNAVISNRLIEISQPSKLKKIFGKYI